MEKIKQQESALQSREERVGQLAFQIWEEEGRPDGKSEEHWYLACLIVDGEAAGTSSEVLPTWLNRNAEDAASLTKMTKPEVVQELNPKQPRRSAA